MHPKPNVIHLVQALLCVSLNWLVASGRAVPKNQKPAMTQAVTALTDRQIAAFQPYTHYASTAYCPPSMIVDWTCGDNCDENPRFLPIAAGGDGASVQYWYVGIDPTLKTIIVAHQGTDPRKIIPLLIDGDAMLAHFNTRLYPGLPLSLEAHAGFLLEHQKTAAIILQAVKNATQSSGLNNITVVGHSLGAALALLDAVHLQLVLPNVTTKVVTYGLPRVGNAHFAAYIDQNVDVTHISNRADPVPTIPGRFMGYEHPQGERHIRDDDTWVACSGEEDIDPRCELGEVHNIFEGKLSDHDGPYDGIMMDCTLQGI